MGKLVGEANTVAPSLNSFGRSEFGLTGAMIGKLPGILD